MIQLGLAYPFLAVTVGWKDPCHNRCDRLAQLGDQGSSLKAEFPLAHVATVSTRDTRPSVAQALGKSSALRAAEEWATWTGHVSSFFGIDNGKQR